MLRTGWDQQQLDATSRATWEGMAWVVFAEQLADDATVDVAARARHLDDQAFEANRPKQAAVDAHNRLRIGEARVALADIGKHRDEVRALLWPPDDDEVPS